LRLQQHALTFHSTPSLDAAGTTWRHRFEVSTNTRMAEVLIAEALRRAYPAQRVSRPQSNI
jgi:hypothetical protein